MHEEDLIEEKKPTNKNSLGYKVGTAFGVLISACLASVLVVTTAKIICWIWLL